MTHCSTGYDAHTKHYSYIMTHLYPTQSDTAETASQHLTTYDGVHCSKPCDAGVWPIYEKPTMQGRRPVRGCFCSPGCVMRFLVSSRIPGADPAWRHNTAMVIRARLKLPPQRAVPIAPPLMALRSHGGHMALEEWRTLAGYGGALPKYDEFTRVRARRAGVRLRGEDAHHHPRREQQGRRGPPVAVDSAPCAGAGP